MGNTLMPLSSLHKGSQKALVLLSSPVIFQELPGEVYPEPDSLDALERVELAQALGHGGLPAQPTAAALAPLPVANIVPGTKTSSCNAVEITLVKAESTLAKQFE